MALTPVEDYHSVPPRPGRSAEAATALLLSAGGGELYDAVLTWARRKELKEMVRKFTAGLTPLERVYVASFLEHDALCEWDEEEGR